MKYPDIQVKNPAVRSQLSPRPLFQIQGVNPDVLAKIQTIAKLVSEEGVAT